MDIRYIIEKKINDYKMYLERKIAKGANHYTFDREKAFKYKTRQGAKNFIKQFKNQDKFKIIRIEVYE